MNETKDDAIELRRGDVLDISSDTIKGKLTAIAAFQAIVRRELKDGHDYGTIPGTPKPTLLKPGAEKIAKLLNCYDEYEIIEKVQDWEKPHFYYLVRCILSDMATGTKISSGLGSCNSYESKYRYRWVEEAVIPVGLDKDTLKTRGGKKTIFEFKFAIEKRETGGQYGKPKEYWDTLDAAIKAGTAKEVTKETKRGKSPGYEMLVNSFQYQVPNPDIFDLVNTFLKMAKKRALVDAALSAGRLSDLFTQDMEDITGVDVAEPEEVEEKFKKVQPVQAQAPKKPETSEFPGSTAADPEQMATEDQLSTISRHIESLKKLGKREPQVWDQVYKKAKERGRDIVELQEMTFPQADYVGLYLGEWIEFIKSGEGKSK